MGKVGLLWVGEKFYATPADFVAEANRMGVSRRIPAVPKGFKVGETFVWLAHRGAVPAVDLDGKWEPTPGVFQVFRPIRVEVVVTGDEPDEEIEGLLKRGLSPVKVVRDTEVAPLLDEFADDTIPGSEQALMEQLNRKFESDN
jgi:hypothetical protein